MERYLGLLGGVSALALVGAIVPGHVASGGADFATVAFGDGEGYCAGQGRATHAPAEKDAPPALEVDPPLMALGLRVAPRGLEHGLVAAVPCEELLPRTGVGSFRPYPECAAVGMPFAGVKMCGEGHATAAR